jgi:HK97 family phage major capsid protein
MARPRYLTTDLIFPGVAAEAEQRLGDIRRKGERLATAAALRRRTAQTARSQHQPPRAPAAPAGNHNQKETNMSNKQTWQGLGDFARAVVNSGTKLAPTDQRLAVAAAPSPSQEGVGSDGGYAAPPEVTSEVADAILGEETVFGRTDRQSVTRNSIVVPVDAAPPWAAPQPQWEGEGHPLATMKLVLNGEALKLHKMSVLIPVTNELYEDATGLGAYLRRAIPERFDFKLTDALLSGTGVGQILGVLNAGAKITQTKEGAQAAGTVAYANLTKMWNRLYGPSRKTAVWLIHPDAELAMQGLTTPGGEPVIVYPPDAPYGYIFGRPAFVTEAAKAIGTEGDIVLMDPRSYFSATRHPEGVKNDVSMHLWFDYDASALRFTMRVGGQPWISAPFQRRNGGTTVSTIVTLENR